MKQCYVAVNMCAPQVFTYLDYRLFLADWFAAQKHQNPRFSYRLFARRAGQSSPSLLHHVIEGKRNLTTTTTEAFCRAMELRRDEADFFTYLVQFDQTKTPEERNEVWRRISATRRFREARRIDGDSFQYLSHWYYPAIRELATCAGFRREPEWIAKNLEPPITEPQARKALEILLLLGLLTEGEEGKLVPAEASVATADEVQGLAAHNYHQGMLDRAKDAIDTFKPDERQFGSVTVAIKAERVPELKKEIAEFHKRMLDLCDASAEADRIYQLNVQLFPLSAPIAEES
jgi:uncharacterized protein (TIGR02147 family)